MPGKYSAPFTLTFAFYTGDFPLMHEPIMHKSLSAWDAGLPVLERCNYASNLMSHNSCNDHTFMHMIDV